MPDIHADLSKKVVVDSKLLEWSPSPMAGVNRKMIERCGNEVAVCCSVVKFDEGSTFDAHTHGMGEEFLVLEGVFSDEHGDYGAGSYIRNPPGSSHTPHIDPGCTIFVRLRQFDPEDLTFVKTNINTFDQEVNVLHQYKDEIVTYYNTPGGASLPTSPVGSLQEIFIISGSVIAQDGDSQVTYDSGIWIRVPATETLPKMITKEGGCKWLHRSGRLGKKQ